MTGPLFIIPEEFGVSHVLPDEPQMVPATAVPDTRSFLERAADRLGISVEEAENLTDREILDTLEYVY
jgi:hypothetical protein